MKAIIILSLLFLGSVSSAKSKLSDPFSLAIVGRVCVKGNCENYSQFFTVQAELNENPNKPGSYTGEAEFSYQIEGIKLVSAVSVSELKFQGNQQINLFLRTTEEGASTDFGSSEVIVKKMSDLNSIAQYSTPLIRTDLRIEPIILIGPSLDAIKYKMLSVFR
jgi:hypothetical protein